MIVLGETMRNDEVTEALNTAIEKAAELSHEAAGLLQTAVREAAGDVTLHDDYRLKHAMKLFNASVQSDNLAAQYFLVRSNFLPNLPRL